MLCNSSCELCTCDLYCVRVCMRKYAVSGLSLVVLSYDSDCVGCCCIRDWRRGGASKGARSAQYASVNQHRM